jgi:L-lactate dehydrogenase
MQLIDPDAFAGRDAFLDQVSFFADQCRRNPPINPERPVRLPGEQATRADTVCSASRLCLCKEKTNW